MNAIKALAAGALALCGSLSWAQDGNSLRNASFEKPLLFNGAPLRQASDVLRFHLASQGKLAFLPAEGWMLEAPADEGASLEQGHAKSGEKALLLAPREGKALSAFSCPAVETDEGAVTLSAWIDNAGAKVSLELEFTEPFVPGKGLPKSVSRSAVQLPADAKGWTRLELHAQAPKNACATAKLAVSGGSARFDDVQLERGASASPFALRERDALELSFDGVAPEKLPFWIESPKGVEARKTLRLKNASFSKLEGELELWLGPWNKPKSLRVAKAEKLSLEPGASFETPVDIAGLEPDAYVVHAVLRRAGRPEIDGESEISASARIGGAHSAHMLKSRCAIRFAISPDFKPERLFGVANGMLGFGWKGLQGDWSGGWPLALFAAAKGEGFACARERCPSEDKAYALAAAGIPFHRMEDRKVEDGAPKDASFKVPGTKSSIDVWSEEGMRLVLEKAAETGKANAANPSVASYQMSNETFFPYRDGLCPTVNADAAFRDYCREVHGDLGTLNRRWGTSYASWEQVEQPASAAYAEELRKRPRKEGAANIDWTAALGDITPEIHKRMLSIPGRGMDWLRWRTESSLKLYNSFRDEAKRYDSKTLYGTNLCWPDFWPQMFIPFLRRSDLAMLDVQYTSGMERALGKPSEMLEILEMAESCAKGKPVWGIEVYVQPQWDPRFARLQNWGMLAHGMSVNLVFAWGPYSDHGVPKEAKAWEKKDAVPMWTLIDLDGARLPAYYECKKSLEEIKAFHKRFDAASLERAEAKTAFYVSRDAAEFSSLESANKPWNSSWTRTRNVLCYLLRMRGVRLDFVDDESLPSKPGRYEKLVVPASYALSREAAGRIASFVKSGGTALLAGPSGFAGEWLERSETLGGEAWAELAWKAPLFTETDAKLRFGGSEAKGFKGEGCEVPAEASPLTDADLKSAGWKRSWGEGLVVAFNAYPDLYSNDPHVHPNLEAWAKLAIKEAGLPNGGRWSDAKGVWSGASKHGEGAPVVEVVARKKAGEKGGELFVFALNQGGAGSGALEIPVGEGAWRVEDAMSGESLGSLRSSNGELSLKLELKPWDCRAFRLLKERSER